MSGFLGSGMQIAVDGFQERLGSGCWGLFSWRICSRLSPSTTAHAGNEYQLWARSSSILVVYSRRRKKGGGGEEEDAKLTTLCLKPFIVTTM